MFYFCSRTRSGGIWAPVSRHWDTGWTTTVEGNSVTAGSDNDDGRSSHETTTWVFASTTSRATDGHRSRTGFDKRQRGTLSRVNRYRDNTLANSLNTWTLLIPAASWIFVYFRFDQQLLYFIVIKILNLFVNTCVHCAWFICTVVCRKPFDRCQYFSVLLISRFTSDSRNSRK